MLAVEVLMVEVRVVRVVVVVWRQIQERLRQLVVIQQQQQNEYQLLTSQHHLNHHLCHQMYL